MTERAPGVWRFRDWLDCICSERLGQGGRMFLSRLVDNRRTDSVAAELRRRRFRLLRLLIERAFDRNGGREVTVLDVGGLERFWRVVLNDLPDGVPVSITLLNLREQRLSLPNLSSLVGDGRAMPYFRDGQFDVAVSNATIEHVGTYEDQRRFASEIRRVGRYYWVQTPNRYFPIEPHFLFPFFQFLPLGLRARLVHRFRLGWYRRAPTLREAREWVSEVRLLSRRELVELFPDCRLYEERVFGLTKSFIAYRLEPPSLRENH